MVFLIYYMFGIVLLTVTHAKVYKELPSWIIGWSILAALFWPISIFIVLDNIVIWKKK